MSELTSAKLASGSRVEMTQLVLPSYANSFGNAFGGRVMQWIDLAAAMAAMRHSRMPVVTASIDQLAFHAPIRVAQIAILRAQVNAVFGSSMEIEVTVDAEDPRTGEKKLCCDAFLTFVALGPDGKPSKAPLLLTETEEEARRAQVAASRRAERIAKRTRA
ncbi:MAG TPA: acyl-CoA thioesterase [Anaeromyxobacteraceae bacterium]|nr:acyl-CoA thioesterase [Anaeromyxobacteraceae bacterium]